MIKQIKQHKFQIIESIIIFITILIFSLIFNNFSLDEAWNYGFAYNISKGLIPYKDFNLVITPLYPILGSLFMTLFGKNIIIYYIFNAIICTILFNFIKKHNSKNYYIIYAVLLPLTQPNYNLFCMLLLYILLTLEDKKSNDYIIGIFLGLIFLTKQNIGIYLCIPSLFTKDIRKIIKRIIGFLIPNIILLIYLILNDSLYQFIDYTLLGVNSFLNNTHINYTCLSMTIIITIILIYKYIKTKDINLIYLICFQGMAFPIIDVYHVMIPFIAALSYLIKKIRIDKKYTIASFLIFIIFTSSYNIYLYKTSNYSYPNNLTTYKYRKIDPMTIEHINNIKQYLKNKNEKIFIINEWAYLLKLETNMPINKYDLLNNGNIGKDGELKIINEISKICQEEKCIFLLNKNEIYTKTSQYNDKILKYINDTYTESGIISRYIIYKNN